MSIDKIVKKINLLHSVSTEAPTPYGLSKEIVSKLNLDWEDPDLRIADLSMGRGTFLLALIEKLEKHGHSRSHIISHMLYGGDVSKVQYMIATKALSLVSATAIQRAVKSGHFLCQDTLNKEWNMKFSAIVGNPPFQEIKTDGGRKDQASNLWSKFWSRAFSLVEDDGQIGIVSPTSWLSPSADLRGEYRVNGHDRLWDVFQDYTSYANVVDVKKHFSEGSSFGYVVVDKSSNRGLTFSDGASTALGFLPKSRFAEAQASLSQTGNLGEHFSISQDRGQGLVVSVPLSRSLTPQHIEILAGSDLPSTGSNNPGLYLYVAVPDRATADRVVGVISECLDLLNDSCRWSGFMNIQVFRMIRW